MNQTQPPSDKWLRRCIFAAVVLVSAVAVSPNPTDPDLWGHVRYGRDALRDGIAATTTYSFSAVGNRWINHENLAEICLALGADHLGGVGLLVVKCLLGVGVVLLVMRHAYRKGVGMLTICLAALLVATNLSFHWSCRPQVFTFCYFALLVALLSFSFHGWDGSWRIPWKGVSRQSLRDSFGYSSPRLRCLWLAPVLFFFWANSHGGFVAGYAIYVAYLMGRGLEAFFAKGSESFGLLRRLTLMAVVAGLATLINPYGPDLHLWLLRSLTRPRPEIRDWWPPNLLDPLFLPLWLIGIAFAVASIFTKKSRDFTQFAILGLTLWQSLEHQRHIPFFAILFGFWMPVHLESFLHRLRVDLPESSATPGGKMTGVTRFAITTVLAVVFLMLGGRLYFRLCELPVKRSKYPIAAAQHIADLGLHGKLVVTYNWAQYMIDAFGGRGPDAPQIVVGFDGRFRTCYPQEIVDMHFDFVLGQGKEGQRFRSPNSPPPEAGRVLGFRDPDLVLVNRRQKHSVKVMEQHAEDWVLLYQDEIAQLWGRAAKYDDPRHAEYIPPARRRVTDMSQSGTVSWPALPRRRT